MRFTLLFKVDTLMIDAHQPEDTYFLGLKNALTGDYVINYAEFAMDILGKNKKQVTKLRNEHEIT